MDYITVLKQPRLSMLWVSQVLSAFGDQLYLLAAMWIAVQAYGSKAAFVAAANSIARIIFGLLGGVLADRLNRGSMMVVSDLVRFVAVLALPIAAAYGPIDFWLLVAVSAIIGIFGALFDPALQASIPAISSSPADIQATTGLMDVTQRIARAVGPSLAGFLVAFFPLHHFFTIDAVSFLISAGAVAFLGSRMSWHSKSEPQAKPASNLADQESASDSQSKSNLVENSKDASNPIVQIFADLNAGLRAIVINKAISYAVIQTFLTAGLWGCAFTIGVPIIVKTSFGATVGDYGLIVGAYGAGNVISNVVLANLKVRRKFFYLFMADVVLGAGFLALGVSHSLSIAMAGAAVAAVGGAMGDLLLLNVLISEIPSVHLGKALSLRLTSLYAGYSVGLLIAEPIYTVATPFVVISSCAALMIAAGLIGVFLFRREDKYRTPNFTTYPQNPPKI